MTRTLCVAALLLLSSGARGVRAEEISSVRVGGGVSVGPELVAWDIGYGAAWDAYIDGFGVRLGGTLGMLSYVATDSRSSVRLSSRAQITPALLTLTPELGVYFGEEKDFRIYYTLELPTRLLALAAIPTQPWYENWWLGARVGVELEQHLRSAALRLRAGLFAGALRNEHGAARPMLSLRLVVEYGQPSLPPPPPLAKHRLCPDGVTPILPGVACP